MDSRGSLGGAYDRWTTITNYTDILTGHGFIQVNLLAEIIKSSTNVRPESLLEIIYEYNVDTQWGEIARPPGK